jgi:hypothetical protein
MGFLRLARTIFAVNFFVIGIHSLWADAPSLNPRARSLSMGSAGVALKGGVDSASMNPAGLADVEKPYWSVFDLTLQSPYDFGIVSTANDYRSAAKGSDEAKKRETLEKFIREVQSTSQTLDVSFYPSYTRKNLHIGFLVNAGLEGRLYGGGVGADLLARGGDSNITAGLIAAGSYSFLNQSLQVGVTLKPLYRFAVFESADQRPLDLAKGKNRIGSTQVGVKNMIFGESSTDNRAFGFGADLGVKYWMQPVGQSRVDEWIQRLRPSFGLTLQDVANTRFFTSKKIPADIKQSLSMGFALQPVWKWIEGAIAFDLRNVLEEGAFENKVHMGAEARIKRFFLIRVGLSQLYLGGGLGLDFKYFQLDAFFNQEEAYEYAANRPLRTLGLRVAAGF